MYYRIGQNWVGAQVFPRPTILLDEAQSVAQSHRRGRDRSSFLFFGFHKKPKQSFSLTSLASEAKLGVCASQFYFILFLLVYWRPFWIYNSFLELGGWRWQLANPWGWCQQAGTHTPNVFPFIAVLLFMKKKWFFWDYGFIDVMGILDLELSPVCLSFDDSSDIFI